MVKTYKIAYYRPVYENLISELRNMWPRDIVTEEEYNIVRSSHSIAKLVVKGIIYKLMTSFFLYLIPLIL